MKNRLTEQSLPAYAVHDEDGEDVSWQVGGSDGEALHVHYQVERGNSEEKHPSTRNQKNFTHV